MGSCSTLSTCRAGFSFQSHLDHYPRSLYYIHGPGLVSNISNATDGTMWGDELDQQLLQRFTCSKRGTAFTDEI